MNRENAAEKCSLNNFGRQTKRCLLSCIVIAALAALLAANGVYEAAAGQNASPATARSAAALASIDAVLDDGAKNLFALPEEMPPLFEAEMFSLSDVDDAQLSSDLHLLGYSQLGGAEDALDALTEKLKEKGWESTASDQALCRSFSKGSGMYRWAYAFAAQVGGSASVVVQWSAVEGDGR